MAWPALGGPFGGGSDFSAIDAQCEKLEPVIGCEPTQATSCSGDAGVGSGDAAGGAATLGVKDVPICATGGGQTPVLGGASAPLGTAVAANSAIAVIVALDNHLIVAQASQRRLTSTTGPSGSGTHDLQLAPLMLGLRRACAEAIS